MSINTIPIPSYRRKNNLVRHSIKIVFDGTDIEQSFGPAYDIDLYNLEVGAKIIIPRIETKLLKIILSFDWEQGRNLSDVKDLLAKIENPMEEAHLRIQLYSPFSKFCLDQKVINLQDISIKNETEFLVDLSKVFGSLIIEYCIARDSAVKGDYFDIAEKPLSILSASKEIEIIIDDIETERTQKNFLPISPDDTGQFLFKISGLDNTGSELPEIHYHQDFDNHFKQDDLLCVDTAFMFSFLSFADNYLKWLLFKSIYDDQNKRYTALIDFISELVEVRSIELREIIINKPEAEDLIEIYLNYSKKLFENFQIKKKFKYKKHLKSLIEKEKRIKILNR
ncbi:MAG: hypothetical protein H0W62_09875 [Chitinophagales bacterium]|nr:hypothetical protein [Chitinophagales bacterium]